MVSYIDYTQYILQSEGYPNAKILIIGCGCNPFSFSGRSRIVLNPEGKDLVKFIEEYRMSSDFELFDIVIMSRVLEHLEVRNLDWYLFNIYTVMKQDSMLICVVPDMKAVSLSLVKEFEKYGKKTRSFSDFKAKRLNYELFSEGNDIMFRHSTWTDENSIKYYLESEGLFKVSQINRIKIDSNITPKQLEVFATRI